MPDEMEELKQLIEDAAGQCHAASHKARDAGHSRAERATAEMADKLEQLHGQLESEYPE